MAEQIVSIGCGDEHTYYVDWYSNKHNTLELKIQIDDRGNPVILIEDRVVYRNQEHHCRPAPNRNWSEHKDEISGKFKHQCN